jgi:hypothetical protein
MKYFLFIFVFITFRLFGQILPQNPLDNSYSPPKGSIFDLKKGKNSSIRKGVVLDRKNILGFNVGVLGRSIAAISYERILTSSFGISMNLGFNFAQDYIRVFSKGYREVGSSDYTSNRARYQNYYSYGSSEEVFNPFIQFKFKYYFDQDPLDGPYISVLYRNYYNNMVYGGSSSNSLDFVGPKYKVSINNVALIFGQCWSGSGNLIHDLYYGVGYSRSNMPLFDLEFKDPNLPEFEKISAIKDTGHSGGFGSILFVLGYSFGFSF